MRVGGCQNGGTCSASDGSCTCKGQTSGPTCSICGCQNGGTCSATDGSCQCKGQTSGPTCSICGCQNGGTCSATDGSCQCKGQTSGPTCSTCGCKNGGTCSAKDGSCTCKGQTSGPTCSTCGCQNSGTCSAADGSCKCVGIWTGSTCGSPPPCAEPYCCTDSCSFCTYTGPNQYFNHGIGPGGDLQPGALAYCRRGRGSNFDWMNNNRGAYVLYPTNNNCNLGSGIANNDYSFSGLYATYPSRAVVAGVC
ncbi:unnamed protein product [Adineta steineri]|uniref:EGF-like domain-containing protein n=1 Tax=Adineta steineri TaxID=433720 RepID=A0A819SZW8_9BILA|nr:unnamed protein product [Adineta steineri]